MKVNNTLKIFEKIRKNKGVTMVALVITIILLVILAGLTINLVSGKNGITERAEQIKENQSLSELTQDLKLKAIQTKMNSDNTNDLTGNYLNDLIEQGVITQSDISNKNDEEQYAYITVEGKYVYLVEQREDDLYVIYEGEPGNLLPKIIDINVMNSTNSINLEVNARRADTYKFYIKENENDEYIYSGSSNDGEYRFTGLRQNKKYYIKVEAINDDGKDELEELARTTGEIPTGTITIADFEWNYETETGTYIIETTATEYYLQYTLNPDDSEAWVDIESGSRTIPLEVGQTIFARITDGVNEANEEYVRKTVPKQPGRVVLASLQGNVTYPSSLTVNVTENISKGTLTVSSLNTNIATATIEASESNATAVVTVNSGTTAGVTTITVTSTPTENLKGVISYEVASATYEVTVEKCDISGITLANIESQNYTGSAITPEPAVSVVVDGNTYNLTKDVDFEYSYSNNVNPGTATVTVTGKGMYEGSVSKTFTINPIVIFNSNGGTGEMANENVTYNANTALTANTFTRTGYTFSGWNTSTNGTGTSYADGANINITENTTLYAQWIINKYDITWQNGNLLNGNQLLNYGSTHTYNNNEYTITASSTYAGMYISSDNFEVGKTYILTYKIQKTAGKLINIGGHAYGQKSFTIDGNNSSYTYSSPTTNMTDNTNVHTIRFEFIYNGNTDNNNIYIQPNRGYEDSVTIKLTELELYEIVKEEEKDYNSSIGILPEVSRIGYTLDGWYTDKINGSKVTTITKVPANDMTYYTHWNANIYKITFNNQGATTSGTTESWYIYNTVRDVTYNGVTYHNMYYYADAECTNPYANTAINIPTKTGYTFEGYYTGTNGTGTQYINSSGGYINNIYATKTEDTTLYANWIPKRLTINYNKNDGSGATSSETFTWDGNMDDNYLNPPSGYNSRTGYTFEGWSLVANGSDNLRYPFTDVVGTNWFLNQIGNDTTKTVNFYAQWTVNKYTITYDLNSDNMNIWNKQIPEVFNNISYNSSTRLSTITITGIGGWEILYMPITTVVGKTYNFKFDYKNLTGFSVYSGYNGIGVEALTNIENSDCLSYSNQTIYLPSNQNNTTTSYTLTFTATTTTTYLAFNFGMVTDSSQFRIALGNFKITDELNYNSQLGTLITPSKQGNTFNGWYTQSTNGTQISSSTTVPAQNVTYYAHWTPNKIKLTLNANGGSGGTTQIWYYYGIEIFYSDANCTNQISAITLPTRAGYSFEEYYGDGTSGGANGESYIYDTDDFAGDLVEDIYKDATLYASWEANTYTITYNSNGGSGGPSTQRFTFNGGEKISTSVPTRSGFTFVNWDYNGNKFNPGDTIPNGWGDFTLTAQWTDTGAPSAVTVTYNSGSNSCTWQNNINITLSATDNVGVSYYEIDTNSDDVADATTGSNYIPTNGWHTHYQRYRAVDTSGNRGPWTGTYHVHMDTQAPGATSITYNSGYNGAVWQNNINITLSASDNIGIAYYDVDWDGDGVENTTTAANFIPWNGWHSGNNRFRAVDHAGNKGPWSDSVYIAMWTEAPGATTVTYNSGSNSCTWQNNINISLSALSGLGIAYYEIDWDNNGTADQTTGDNFIPGNGHSTCTQRYRAVDHAGNRGAWTGTYHVHMDTQAPGCTSVQIANVTSDGYDVYVYGASDNASGINRIQFPTWTDANGQDDIQSSWDTNSVASGTDQGNGTWYYRVNSSAHNNESGTYYTHIYAWDNVGNYQCIGTGSASVPQGTIYYIQNSSLNSPAKLVNSDGTTTTYSNQVYSYAGKDATVNKKYYLDPGNGGGYVLPNGKTLHLSYVWTRNYHSYGRTNQSKHQLKLYLQSTSQSDVKEEITTKYIYEKGDTSYTESIQIPASGPYRLVIEVKTTAPEDHTAETGIIFSNLYID